MGSLISPVADYAADPQHTLDGAAELLRQQLDEAQSAERLCMQLTGTYSGAASTRERLGLIRLRLAEARLLADSIA